MGARALGAMDNVEDREKTVFISWHADGPGFSAKCLKVLTSAFEIFLDAENVIFTDPSLQECEAVPTPVDTRHKLSTVTDFVGLITNEYLVDAKARCKAPDDPELVVFVKHKLSSGNETLKMWLFPLNDVPLKLVAAFKGKGIPNLDFPWWHGATERIIMPMKGDLDSEQKLINEINGRAAEIADAGHPSRCTICSRHC